MSNHSVIVRKGEIFVKLWNTEIRDYEEKSKTEQVLSDVLQFPLIVEDTTFGQFFTLISKEKELYEKVFKAALYGHPLEPYIKECDLPAKTSKDVDFIRVYWGSELYEGELDLDACFDGWGDWNTEDAPEKGGIALEFTPLNEYKDLPFRLDTNCDIHDFLQREPLVKATKKFSVYDVINAILFEITWAGDISKGRGAPWEKDKKGEQAA